MLSRVTDFRSWVYSLWSLQILHSPVSTNEPSASSGRLSSIFSMCTLPWADRNENTAIYFIRTSRLSTVAGEGVNYFINFNMFDCQMTAINVPQLGSTPNWTYPILKNGFLTKQTVTNHTRNSDKCGCHLSENVDDWTWKIQNLFREKSSTPAPKHANVKDWVWQMQKGQTRKSRYRQGQIQSPVKQTNQNCVKVAAPSYVICCMLHAYIG